MSARQGTKQNKKGATRKRKHGAAFGAGKAQSSSSLLAKKARKNCRKVKLDEKFCEVSLEDRLLLDIDYPLDECLVRRGVHSFVSEMRESKIHKKINIPVTHDFVMTIQNVVMTVELRCREPSSSYRTTTSQPSMKQKEVDSFPAPLLDMFVTPFAALDMVDGHPQSIDELLRDPGVAGARDDVQVETPRPDNQNDFYIPLNELTLYWRSYGAQHNNRRFTAVILRNYELNAASLVFSSGNIVCTGADRPELALWLLHSTLEKLQDAGFDTFETPRPQLRNIVSSGRFPNTICTALLAVLYSNNCMRTDKFPGTMIFHPDMGKRVALIFDSGKICHSGAHSIEEIVDDMKVIWPILERCQYTVQNQKDDDICRAILGVSPNASNHEAIITEARQKIEQAYEQHKQDVKVKRIKSAQMRAQVMRQKKQQQQEELLKKEDDAAASLEVSV